MVSSLEDGRCLCSIRVRWLGHKSITSTVDLYGHLVPEACGRARDALDNAFRDARMCPQSAPGDHR